MRPTRVLLADASEELNKALDTALPGHGDLRLVGSADGEMAVLLRAGQVDADVVVLGTFCDALPPLAERLVDEYPEVGVLAVDIPHDRALIHRRRPSTEWIPDLTATGFAVAIRRAAAPRTT